MKDIFSDVTVVLKKSVFEGMPQAVRRFLAVDSTKCWGRRGAVGFYFRQFRWYEEENKDIQSLLEHLEGVSQDDYSIREAVILRQRPYGSGCNKGHYFGPFEVYYVPRLVMEVSGSMSRLNSKVYVAIGEAIYAFERAELRAWLYAKGVGGFEREGDPEVMGEKLRSVYSVKRRAFPAALRERICFSVDGFERADYLQLWEALVKGAEQFEAAVKERVTRGS